MKTPIPGKRYSRIECLRGDAGPDFQELVFDLIGQVGTSDNHEEQRLYRGLVEKRDRQKRQHEQPAAAPAFSADNERLRLRAELMKRL